MITLRLQHMIRGDYKISCKEEDFNIPYIPRNQIAYALIEAKKALLANDIEHELIVE